MRRRTGALRAGWLLALLAGSAAGRLSPLRAEDVALKLDDDGRGTYQVKGGFEVTASSRCIWEVLTDYEHLPQWVAAFERSRIEQRWNSELLLAQTASEKVVLVRRRVHVLLDIQERAYEGFSFNDLMDKDFKSYRGDWSILPSSAGLRVVYGMEVEPNFPVPAVLVRRIIRKDARKLLEGMRREILRRALSEQSLAVIPAKNP